MITVDKLNRIPIYEQLIDSIKKEIINGFLAGEDMIPSVRALSIELSVNPNTIQKAYNELERAGITRSVPGVGRYVSNEAVSIIKREMENDESQLRGIVINLKLAGKTEEEILKKVKIFYGGEEND